MPPAELRVAKARAMADLLGAGEIPHARLVECRENEQSSSVIVELDVQVSQLPCHDIRPTECVAIRFRDSDDHWPAVFALRNDFPRDLLHLLLVEIGEPVALCINEQDYAEAKARWTPARYILEVRSWLARAADEQLHAPDQPLERILIRADGHLVVPQAVMDGAAPAAECAVAAMGGGLYALVAPDDLKRMGWQDAGGYVWAHLRAPARQHGTVFYGVPKSLADLLKTTHDWGWDIRKEMEAIVRGWFSVGKADQHPIFLIFFPLKRSADIPDPETVDVWAFTTNSTVRQVGIDLGLLASEGGQTSLLLVRSDTGTEGNKTELIVLNPQPLLSSKSAAHLNGRETSPAIRTTVVGVGAVGSQVLTNIVRSGMAPQHVIDHDRLLPHNVARHQLTNTFLGASKAAAMAGFANSILQSSEPVSAIYADVTAPGDAAESVKTALQNVDVILDFSASVAVARHLAVSTISDARRISLFLNPAGSDLVLFAEDRNRTVRLDEIEAQYYWHVAASQDLDGHLAHPEQVRTARSCRDLSSRIPQSRVATLCGIGSEMILRHMEVAEMLAAIWRMDPTIGTVRRVDLEISPTIRFRVGGWQVSISCSAVQRLRQLRAEKHPKETGGVLIGSWDTERKLMYIVGALAAPSDSTEEREAFFRGAEGLRAEVSAIQNKTANMLGYVGEWHSHPDGIAPIPSADDKRLYEWLADKMKLEGYPPTMLIIGQGGDFSCMIETRDEVVVPSKAPCAAHC